MKAAVLALLLSASATAQTVGGGAPPVANQSCNEIQAGTARGYACLNAQLGAIARNTKRPSSADAPYSATSPGNVTGQFNQAATAERLGTNFGKSGVPQRPVTNYAAPFTPPPR